MVKPNIPFRFESLMIKIFSDDRGSVWWHSKKIWKEEEEEEGDVFLLFVLFLNQ